MASLKRYRQTNDSNAAARFRDLPPRFKRQKSIPSTESGTIESPIKFTQNHKPKKFSEGDCLISEGSGIDSTLSGVVEESEISKNKRIMKRGSGTHPQLTVDRNFARRVTQPIVLSPMDNKLFNFVRNDEQESSSMVDFNPVSWQDQQQLQWSHYPTYDNTGNFQTETQPYNGTWAQTLSNHQTKESPSYHTTNHPGAAEPPKDYSENDRRIIEMFKELERVADQKEKEEDEDGADRKSLVSHHLRMLMCAIDKYTEGIEDEEECGGRGDESYYNDRSSSPSPAKSIAKTPVSPKESLDNQQSAQRFSTKVTSTAETQTAPAVYVQSHQATDILPTMHQRALYNVSAVHNEERPSDILSKIKPSLSVDMQPWDLWSSPSFNVLDVYSYLSKGHNSSETADSTFALFDQLEMENHYSPWSEEYLNRIPLYKR